MSSKRSSEEVYESSIEKEEDEPARKKQKTNKNRMNSNCNDINMSNTYSNKTDISMGVSSYGSETIDISDISSKYNSKKSECSQLFTKFEGLAIQICDKKNEYSNSNNKIEIKKDGEFKEFKHDINCENENKLENDKLIENEINNFENKSKNLKEDNIDCLFDSLFTFWCKNQLKLCKNASLTYRTFKIILKLFDVEKSLPKNLKYVQNKLHSKIIK